MSAATFGLLAHRRFLPLFVGQFLGAANDNFFKNALVILVVFRLGDQGGLPPAVLATVAAGLFIAPYFLFSAIAGSLADHREKSALMRLWKGLEIPISALGGWALISHDVALMLVALFLLGLQSTFTSPIKYAILPEYLPPEDLIGGNALMEGGTFLAILLGTIGGGTLVLRPGGEAMVAVLMLVLAVVGFAVTLMLPKAHLPPKGGRPGWNVWRESVGLVRLVRGHRPLFLAVMGISWFWLLGATYLSQFPAFAKTVLGADEHVVSLMLTMFSLGIGCGSVLCGRLARGRVPLRWISLAALGMTLFGLDLALSAGPIGTGTGEGPVSLLSFLHAPAAWRLLGDLLGLSVCGGLFTVPLYTLLQSASDEAVRSRVVAANNLLNAVFMVAGAGMCAGLLAWGLDVAGIFLVLALANLGCVWGLRGLSRS